MEMSSTFWIAVVGIPAIVWGMYDCLDRWLKFKEKMLTESARQAAEVAARHVATIERLEQRTAVLERIVTDKGVETAVQIDKLRNAPLN